MGRTLIVHHWTFHTARVHNPIDLPPCDLGGVDLLEYVKRNAPGLQRRDPNRQRWVAVSSVALKGARSVLLTAEAGALDEPGRVVDSKSGSGVFDIQNDHVATAATRTLIVVPDSGLSAFAFYERSTGRGTSGLDVFGVLKSMWLSESRGITWGAEWLEVDARRCRTRIARASRKPCGSRPPEPNV